MSVMYDRYLSEHKANVANAYRWIENNLPEIIKNGAVKAAAEYNVVFNHDHSKDKFDEYSAYDAYFYGGNRSYKVVNDFRKAWLLHIHRNPHHWQYWVLVDDDPKEGTIALPMDYEYIVEMICDWWSFSWKTGNLYEIFNWYEEHSKHIILHDSTRKIVVDILNKIKMKLDLGANNG